MLIIVMNFGVLENPGSRLAFRNGNKRQIFSLSLFNSVSTIGRVPTLKAKRDPSDVDRLVCSVEPF